MTAVSYTIEPIEGRAAIQKNFVKLPERAANYSNRRVTLNERFSIIERGYYLKPVELPKATNAPPRVSLVCVNAVSREEVMAATLAKMEKKHAEEQRRLAKSQETSPCVSPPRSIESVSP
ncbi:hypothetical protein OESDEN_23461 [Oesophagostomum dentatum]|uniref:Uncharacterized protein n=1 Tax=Oesophagostomum dentatum TaxID=61180 RepID=A0A0B1RW62_OESDE|nr:hypothetical protein OESDEN_23461 [Oesophagostomum dentatum]